MFVVEFKNLKIVFKVFELSIVGLFFSGRLVRGQRLGHGVIVRIYHFKLIS